MKVVLIVLFLISPVLAVDFNRDIKPILSRNCFSCHGKDKQKGDLRLDNRKFASTVLKVEGNGNNLLLKKVFEKDPEEVMPPPKHGTLSNSDKILLKKWILEGAPYDKHWSFKPLKKIKVPQIKDEWISNDIDKFILQKLKNSV